MKNLLKSSRIKDMQSNKTSFQSNPSFSPTNPHTPQPLPFPPPSQKLNISISWKVSSILLLNQLTNIPFMLMTIKIASNNMIKDYLRHLAKILGFQVNKIMIVLVKTEANKCKNIYRIYLSFCKTKCSIYITKRII